MIVNEDIWSDNTWRAMGVGIVGKHANVWFGEQTDPAGYIE